MNHGIACNLIGTAERHPGYASPGERSLASRELDDTRPRFAGTLPEFGVVPAEEPSRVRSS
jgi:hypothetical protein